MNCQITFDDPHAAETCPCDDCVEARRQLKIEEQGLPETIRETFPNDQKLAGTFVIYCIGETIEVKARGLKPRQIAKILFILLAKIFS